MSGFPEEVQKEGPEDSHDLAPRAKIFRRDQANVRDGTSFSLIIPSVHNLEVFIIAIL